MSRSLISILFLLSTSFAAAQTAGQNFGFTEIPISVSSAALGGNQLASNSQDVNQLSANPALLDSTLDKNLSITYLDYLSDIKQTTLSYAQFWKNKGLVSGYFRYLDYGTFLETDEFGNELKEFKATNYELGLNFTKSYTKRLSYGVSVKNYFSGMYGSFAYGVAFDFGGYYTDNKGFTAGANVGNLGLKLIDNQGQGTDLLPINASIGLTKKFKRAPIRFGLQYNHLEKWDLAALDLEGRSNVEIDPLTGESERRILTLDNFARHMTFSVSIEPSDKFSLMSGFNVRRRLELAATQRPGLVGFSFGLQFKIKRFAFQYAVSSYYINSVSNHLSLSTNLNQWYSKKNIKE